MREGAGDTWLYSRYLVVHANDYGDLWDVLDNIPVISESSGEHTDAPIFEQQLLKYLEEVRVPQSTDIYGYWHCS